MGRLQVVVAVIVLIAEVAALVNCILTPEDRVRGLPKWAWILLIVLLPAIGSALWFGVGAERVPRGRGVRPGGVGRGPDDDTAFLGATDRLQLSERQRAAQDDRIRRLEAELAALERESDEDGGRGPSRG